LRKKGRRVFRRPFDNLGDTLVDGAKNAYLFAPFYT
jgi:hypothetical protein